MEADIVRTVRPTPNQCRQARRQHHRQQDASRPGLVTRDRIALCVGIAGLAIGVATGLSGCSNTAGSRAEAGDGASGPVVGLDALAAGDESTPRGPDLDAAAGGAGAEPGDDDLARRAEASAAALDQLFREGGATPEPGTQNEWVTTAPTNPSASSSAGAGDAGDAALPTGAADGGAMVPTQPLVFETLDDRIVRLQAELAEAVSERRGTAAFPSAVEAALVHAVAPGEREPSTLGLTVPEQRSLGALKLVNEGFLRGRASSGSPSDAAATLNLALAAIESDGRVRIAEARLCSRVLGYGQWTPLGRSSFVAGRRAPMIVYAEIEGFGTRDATPRESQRMGIAHAGANRAAEMDVSLELYHASDGVLAWQRPAERVVDVSRRHRRDFYVLAEIELPSPLSVGGYAMKVRVTDRVSGTEDEMNIPITIVADASALTNAPTD